MINLVDQKDASMDDDLICYQFDRRQVEGPDFSDFIDRFAPDKLPNGPRLRKMMGTFLFAVTDYDDDPRELNSIPEVRVFYSAFHKAWPYWLYFCKLDDDRLKLMVYCCLEDQTVLKVEGQPNYGTLINPSDVVRFISDDFRGMNDMCERAGMTEREIYNRSKAVFEYFEFPFNVAPPAEG
jgi:hypothetical protein